MAINDILKKITDEADKKRAFMKQLADKEIKKIRDEAKMQANDRRSEIAEKAIRKSASIIGKAKVLANMESKSKLLAEKRQVIDQAYAEVLKELLGLDKNDYTALLVKMLKGASKRMPIGHLTIPESRKSETQEAISKAGIDYTITHETTEFKGGFMVSGNKVDLDISFEKLIDKSIRPATELEVTNALFS